MGTPLTGQTKGSTYDGLLKTTDSDPVTGTLKTICDGLGTDSALRISSAGIASSGTLAVTGVSALAGVTATSIASSGAVSGTTGTFSGAVSGVTGTFSGPVSGTTGSFSGAIVGTTGAFSGALTAPSITLAGGTALSNYTEGTFTPSIGGTATYTSRTGVYTRIGRLVFFDIDMKIATRGTGSQTNISGLPFTSSASFPVVVGYYDDSATAFVHLTGITNGSTIDLFAGTAATIQLSNATYFNNISRIIVSGCFSV